MCRAKLQDQSHCPACHRPSAGFVLGVGAGCAILQWEGAEVRIELRARRFFCDADGCAQRVFTEQV